MEEKERMKTGKFINQSEKMKDRERKNSSCNRMSKAQSTAGKTALCLASALFLSFVPMGAGICEVPVQVEEEKDTFDTNIYIEADESGISPYTVTTRKINGIYTSVEYPVLQIADGSSLAVIDGINLTFQKDAEKKLSEQ